MAKEPKPTSTKTPPKKGEGVTYKNKSGTYKLFKGGLYDSENNLVKASEVNKLGQLRRVRAKKVGK